MEAGVGGFRSPPSAIELLVDCGVWGPWRDPEPAAKQGSRMSVEASTVVRFVVGGFGAHLAASRKLVRGLKAPGNHWEVLMVPKPIRIFLDQADQGVFLWLILKPLEAAVPLLTTRGCSSSSDH